MRMAKILIGFALVLSFQAQLSFADEEIICRVKGSGQKVFRLESGFFSSSVFVKNRSGNLLIGVQRLTRKSRHSAVRLRFVNFLALG